jgi:hypothetical protein
VALAQQDPRIGNRLTTPILTLSAANTTGTLYTLPTDGQSAIIRKLMVSSSDSGNANLKIGTGTPHASFAASLPSLLVVNGMDTEWAETVLPAVEFLSSLSAGVYSGAITAEVDAHTAGSVLVIAEVELFPGFTAHV